MSYTQTHPHELQSKKILFYAVSSSSVASIIIKIIVVVIFPQPRVRQQPRRVEMLNILPGSTSGRGRPHLLCHQFPCVPLNDLPQTTCWVWSIASASWLTGTVCVSRNEPTYTKLQRELRNRMIAIYFPQMKSPAPHFPVEDGREEGS